MDKPIIFADEINPSTASRRVAAHTLRRVERGIYTTELDGDLGDVVRRHWRIIAGRQFSGAVITGRSALTGGPVDGVLYLVAPAQRRRTVRYPGLQVVINPGAGPVDGDIEYPDGLFQASIARAIVENAQPSRRSANTAPWTLTDDELQTWLDRLCQRYGEDKLAECRTAFEQLAPQLDVSPAHVARASELIGAILGSRTITPTSKSLTARLAGAPYDPDRINLFRILIDALHDAAPQVRPAQPATTTAAFFEAYFSNFIEGTEFTLDEAHTIIDTMTPPEARPADGHDLLGTFKIVADNDEMSTIADNATEFVELMTRRHAVVMEGRPEMRPGTFKQTGNQAGATIFVAPELVDGTLEQGFNGFAELASPWQRAVYAMFIVAETHPFNDGNGRLARITMNTYLTAGHETRIIVPTVLRSDYLTALRQLSRVRLPGVLLDVLRFAQDYTSRIDFSSVELATHTLTSTNAFEDADQGHRIKMPDISLTPRT